MLNSTILSSKDITELVNSKVIDKGIEVTHIEINNGIVFSGRLFNVINSKFSASLYIKSFFENRIILETKNIKIDKLGIFKGISSLLLKNVVSVIGEDYISIKGNGIIIDLDKYKSDITDIYIKDKLLYIIGTNLKMYINA
ncbi:hypothetical protein H9660_01550 [Clostridium sp. Sa3CUN1]|uniref:Uncharacterized protein n=1 Tax=Clostridium gallinarum TaxID=2762246 RepID=A0ABR8Q076_9CLOT|nr:hypothetical protein [Clostridium gallinarum]MBD7913823.1 hypothetical protein [Clostridium gallinarum]